jgi:hypothetical protein
MALVVEYKKKLHGVTLKSGWVYTFKYTAWRNDPKPTAIFLYAFRGTHPKTGREWRFLQCINLAYLPRSMRKAFITEWAQVLRKMNGNVKLTWNIVEQRYGWIKFATRRYFYTPSYYISDIEELPLSDLESIVTGTWAKDYSKKLRIALMQKFSSAWKQRNITKKKAKKVGKEYGFFGKKV